MAIYKALLASLLVSLFVLHLVVADGMGMQTTDAATSSPPKSSPPKKIDCGGACSSRCQLSSRPNLCKRACGTCCARCNCVPPGTSGNEDVCPCYASMTTHGGRHKCP